MVAIPRLEFPGIQSNIATDVWYYCMLVDLTGSNDRVLVATGFIQGEGLENARTSEVVDVTAGEDKTCESLDQAPNNRFAIIFDHFF